MSASMLRWILAAGIAGGSWGLGWLLWRVTASKLRALARRSRSELDDLVLSAYGPLTPLWFLAVGMWAAMRFLGLDGDVGELVDRVILAGVILSVTMGTAEFASRFLSVRVGALGNAIGTTSITQNVVRIAIVGVGALVVLTNLGIAITPILTALGVGSLAVALALQPTLTNLFAGFYVSIAQQIRVGDFIELETGQLGYVTDIGWRSTQIRELPNNLILIPNARLAEIIIRNYAFPDPGQAVLVQVGVSYGSDLEHVERVAREVAREAMANVSSAPEFDPFIRFHTFGESSVNFTVVLRVQAFPDRYALTHTFVKRLHERFAQEGIEIPFPQRVLHLEGAMAPSVR